MEVATTDLAEEKCKGNMLLCQTSKRKKRQLVLRNIGLSYFLVLVLKVRKSQKQILVSEQII